jgi:F-type H+-transporting ATPase subunit b
MRSFSRSWKRRVDMTVHVPKGILWGAVNFALFVFLLRYLLRMPLKDFFATRRVRLTKATAEGECLLNDAGRRFKEAEEKKRNLSVDAEKITTLLKEEGSKERQQIVGDAGEHSMRLISEIGRSAQRDEKRMREKLSDEMSRAVVRSAGKKIREKMNANIDKRLKDNFVERLKGL